MPSSKDNTAGMGQQPSDSPNMTPMNAKQIASWEINPQAKSPFYNGRLPSEVRLMIFKFALMEQSQPGLADNHDFRVRNDHDGKDDDDLEPGIVPETTHAGKSTKVTHKPFIRPDTTNLDVYDTNELPRYDPIDRNGGTWARPGCLGVKTMSVTLLRICRRVYLETRDAIANRELSFWYYRSPGMYMNVKDLFCDDVTRYQANRIKSIRLHTQMYWLTDDFYALCDDKHANPLRSIENLTIVIRKSDWWYNEFNFPLQVSPYDQGSVPPPLSFRRMYRNMEMTESFNLPRPGGRARKAGSSSLSSNKNNPMSWKPPLEIPSNGWGNAFQHLPNLKKLTMEFDTSEDKKGELETIVEWAARVWRFPLGWRRTSSSTSSSSDQQDEGQDEGQDEQQDRPMKYHFLSADGIHIRKTSWRGLPAHWADRCTVCEQYHLVYYSILLPSGPQPPADCAGCDRRKILCDWSLGPRMYTWAVTWKPRVDEAAGEKTESDVFGEGEGKVAKPVDCWDEAEDELVRRPAPKIKRRVGRRRTGPGWREMRN
jgi:hypothetical protein